MKGVNSIRHKEGKGMGHEDIRQLLQVGDDGKRRFWFWRNYYSLHPFGFGRGYRDGLEPQPHRQEVDTRRRRHGGGGIRRCRDESGRYLKLGTRLTSTRRQRKRMSMTD